MQRSGAHGHDHGGAMRNAALPAVLDRRKARRIMGPGSATRAGGGAQRPRTLRTTATTLSTVKPNSLNRSGAGADSP